MLCPFRACRLGRLLVVLFASLFPSSSVPLSNLPLLSLPPSSPFFAEEKKDPEGMLSIHECFLDDLLGHEFPFARFSGRLRRGGRGDEGDDRKHPKRGSLWAPPFHDALLRKPFVRSFPFHRGYLPKPRRGHHLFVRLAFGRGDERGGDGGETLPRFFGEAPPIWFAVGDVVGDRGLSPLRFVHLLRKLAFFLHVPAF